MKTPVLLDTCAWIDGFSNPDLLKPAIRNLIGEQQVIHLSAISLLEVARKEARGELIFGMPLAEWFRASLRHITVLPLTTEISIDATRLPEWDHRDPADQIIVAAARIHGLTVLTSDAKILSYPHVKSLASRR